MTPVINLTFLVKRTIHQCQPPNAGGFCLCLDVILPKIVQIHCGVHGLNDMPPAVGPSVVDWVKKLVREKSKAQKMLLVMRLSTSLRSPYAAYISTQKLAKNTTKPILHQKSVGAAPTSQHPAQKPLKETTQEFAVLQSD